MIRHEMANQHEEHHIIPPDDELTTKDNSSSNISHQHQGQQLTDEQPQQFNPQKRPFAVGSMHVIEPDVLLKLLDLNLSDYSKAYVMSNKANKAFAEQFIFNLKLYDKLAAPLNCDISNKSGMKESGVLKACMEVELIKADLVVTIGNDDKMINASRRVAQWNLHGANVASSDDGNIVDNQRNQKLPARMSFPHKPSASGGERHELTALQSQFIRERHLNPSKFFEELDSRQLPKHLRKNYKLTKRESSPMNLPELPQRMQNKLDAISKLLICERHGCNNKFKGNFHKGDNNDDHNPIQSRVCSHNVCRLCVIGASDKHNDECRWLPCLVCNMDEAHVVNNLIVNKTLIQLSNAMVHGNHE